MKKLILFNIVIWCMALSIPNFEQAFITLSLDNSQINIPASIEINRSRECRNASNYELTLQSDLRQKSYLTADDYNYMLRNTELNGLGQALVNAEENYNVNGLYLMGLACLESGYGTSGYARYRNNLVGWNAIDSNPDLATYFESKDECIRFVAEKLSINYLNENGCFFEGYTPESIDIHYCTDKLHAAKIIQIVNNLKEGR